MWVNRRDGSEHHGQDFLILAESGPQRLTV
ncbi:hypothetical protein ACUXJ7_002472, partial [Micrococcus aloeverae]